MISKLLRLAQGADRRNKIFWLTKKWVDSNWQSESEIVHTVQQMTGAFGGICNVPDRVFPAVSALEIHEALAALCDQGIVEWYGSDSTETFWKLS